MRPVFIMLCFLLSFGLAACGTADIQQTAPAQSGGAPSASAEESGPDVQAGKLNIYLDASESTEERTADLLSKMSLADKAAQMVQGEQYNVTKEDMSSLGLGSVLSGGGSVPGNDNTVNNWKKTIDAYQEAALSRTLPIPFIYGSDAVHGHSIALGAVIFPHNIGIGAAGDAALTREMGAYVAEEMKLTGILWNFGPCVAVAQDPRWGRTYESFSSDPALVGKLASAYLKGQQDGGVLSAAKHYAGDGGTKFGTGEGDYLIDRGDAAMDEETFRKLHLAPYKELVENGLQCVMVSFSSYNGLKMHENKYLITDILKGEFGFKGFVVSDWEGIAGIDAPTYEAKVAAAVNAGVDMLMEPNKFKEALQAIISGVNSGAIPKKRVDDAVSRILTVKFNLGLFEDPYLDHTPVRVDEIGSAEGRALAKKLVEESQVLLKNENDILPFKRGQKIYVMGPAADNIGVQCGGWTLSWQGIPDCNLAPGKTILQGFESYADEYGLTVITDESRADEADAVVLAIGEKPYAEYEGDTEDLSITGRQALGGNADAIKEAQGLGKPIVTLIVAGRNVLIGEYMDGWDAVVMCYLPGTEGDGVAAPLVGDVPFTGRLPMPWYKSVDDIGKDNPDLLYETGYGLG